MTKELAHERVFFHRPRATESAGLRGVSTTLRALVGVISEEAMGACWGVEQEEGVRVSVELRSSWELADPIPAERKLRDQLHGEYVTFYR